MADTVFLLGAGASRHMNAPLMFDFLDRAEAVQHRFGARVNQPAFSLVMDLVHSRLDDLHAKSVVEVSDVESVFGIIEMAKLVGRLPRTRAEDINACSEAMRTVLAETIECSCQFPLDQGRVFPSHAYLQLVRACIRNGRNAIVRGDAAFVTFNYDIGLDYALHWTSHVIDYGLGAPPPGSIPLYKLHGSLHWALCSDGQTVLPASLSRVNDTATTMPVAEGNQEFVYLQPTRILLPALCPGTGSVTGPAIVPPTWNKTQYHSTFGAIWAKAAAEICEARRIFVIGYSAARSDSFFRDLLALSLAGNARLREFGVIDPNEAVRDGIWELLGPTARATCRPMHQSFEGWTGALSHLFPDG